MNSAGIHWLIALQERRKQRTNRGRTQEGPGGNRARRLRSWAPTSEGTAGEEEAPVYHPTRPYTPVTMAPRHAGMILAHSCRMLFLLFVLAPPLWAQTRQLEDPA